jgi:hypothetical protein
MVAVFRGSESGILYGVVDTGTGSFLISGTGAAAGAGGALAGRGTGGSSRLFHMLTFGALPNEYERMNET